MTPNMKVILVILTMAMGVMLITSKVEAQEAKPVVKNSIDDFKLCSIWIKNENRTLGLIEPLKEHMDKITKNIKALGTELLQIEMIMNEYSIMMQKAHEDGLWEVQEDFYRRYNQTATKGNAISQEMIALNGFYLRLAAGTQRRVDVFNKLNDQYLSNCMVSWPTAVFDAACSTKQYDTIDFCEKFPND